MGRIVTQADPLSARARAGQAPPSTRLLRYARAVYDVVYVSPHLDDAVFSAGGAIALEVRAGRRVAVATVFSRGGGDDARRRDEDHAALAGLGATAIDLALVEAPARDPRLARGRLFLPLGPDSAALVEEVRAAVHAVAGDAEVVAPLGVGRHVDHQIAHAAAAALAGPVSYYEDLPYALCRPLVARRLASLGSPGSNDEGALAALWNIARFWSRRPFLNDAAPWPLRPLAAALIAFWQWQSPSETAPAARPLLEERIDVSSVLDDKLRAIAAYSSQWRRFFFSLEAFRGALAAHALGIGSKVAVERRWRRG